MQQIEATVTSTVNNGRLRATSEDFITGNFPVHHIQIIFSDIDLLSTTGNFGLELLAGEITLPIINPYGYNIRTDSLIDTIRGRLPRRLREVDPEELPADLLRWASTFTAEVKQDNNRLVIYDPMRRTDFVPTWDNVTWAAPTA